MAVRLGTNSASDSMLKLQQQHVSHVPTSSTGKRSELVPCPQSQTDLSTIPLSSAVGAPVPLYQYAAGGAASSLRADTSNEDQPLVPDLFTTRTNASWNLSDGLLEFQQLSKVAEPQQSAKAGSIGLQRDFSSQSLPSLTVPVHPDTIIKPESDVRWYTHRLSDPFLHVQLPGDEASELDLMTGSEDMSTTTSPVGASPMLMSPQPSCSDLLAMSTVATRSTLDTLVTALWEDCDSRGLFRYDVSQCLNRVVPGQWGWVAQLNEGRGNKKRPTELKVDAVMQPFDAGRFHFGKAFLKEVLLQFEPLPAGHSTCQNGEWAANMSGARVMESHCMTPDPTLVMINVSPIDYGHVLLVPRVLAQRPQQLDTPSLSSALAFVREVANPTFRLGYNSLGAYATINHLHFQGYYLPNQLPCEKAATRPVPGFHHDTLTVSWLVDYPVAGWVVEVQEGLDNMACEGDMAALLVQICGRLQELDQPFNVLLVDQGRKAFVWPQCYAERQAAGVVPEDMLDTGVNPAVFEIAGHLILKRAQDFEHATDGWAARLLSGVSLTKERFHQLSRQVLRL